MRGGFELLARNGLSSLVGEGDYAPVKEANGPKAIFSFCAVKSMLVDLMLPASEKLVLVLEGITFFSIPTISMPWSARIVKG
jgi:hypothetical protein